MRDLRRAAHEGVKPFLHSLIRIPDRHPFLIAFALFGIALVLGIFGYTETGQKVTRVERNVTAIQAASPCISAPKSGACKRSFEQAVLTITHPEACAILRKAGLEVVSCAGARLRQERGRRKERAATRAIAQGGDARNPSHAGQQPKPGSHPGSRHPSSQPAPGATEPAPASAPSTPAPVPSPLPGNSGSAPAPDRGVKACVELAVSACVKAPDLPTP